MLTSEKIKQMLYRIPYPPKPEMDYVQKQQDYMVADSKPQPPQSSMVLTQVPLYGRADRQDSNAIRDKYGYLKEGKLLDSYRPTYRGRRDKSRHSRDRKLVNSYRSARGSLGSTSRAYSSPRSHPGPASSPRSGPRSLRSPPFPPSRRRKGNPRDPLLYTCADKHITVFCGTSDVATMQGDVFLVASVTEKWRIMYDCECSYEPRKGIHLSFYPSEPGEITEQIPMELPY